MSRVPGGEERVRVAREAREGRRGKSAAFRRAFLRTFAIQVWAKDSKAARTRS